MNSAELNRGYRRLTRLRDDLACTKICAAVAVGGTILWCMIAPLAALAFAVTAMLLILSSFAIQSRIDDQIQALFDEGYQTTRTKVNILA